MVQTEGKTLHDHGLSDQGLARASDGSLPKAVKIDLECSLSYGELARLCRAMEHAVSAQTNPVVQFVSAYDGEGANTIAFETAIIAATRVGKRVLFIDTLNAPRSGTQALASAVKKPLPALLTKGGSLNEAIVAAAGTSLFYASFPGHEEEITLADVNAIKSLFETLRQSFDLIIINSEAVLRNVSATLFAKLVDGSILVVEAERIRKPVAKQIQNMIESNGGHVIGAVMNRRRFYIPRWLYRILYKSWGKAV